MLPGTGDANTAYANVVTGVELVSIVGSTWEVHPKGAMESLGYAAVALPTSFVTNMDGRDRLRKA